jgi:hypothetical protein
MTSSRTILIERNWLFRQGLKHLLAGTRFAVKVEFGTMEQAVDGAVTSDLVITGEVGKESGEDLRSGLAGQCRHPEAARLLADSRRYWRTIEQVRVYRRQR